MIQDGDPDGSFKYRPYNGNTNRFQVRFTHPEWGEKEFSQKITGGIGLAYWGKREELYGSVLDTITPHLSSARLTNHIKPEPEEPETRPVTDSTFLSLRQVAPPIETQIAKSVSRGPNHQITGFGPWGKVAPIRVNPSTEEIPKGLQSSFITAFHKSFPSLLGEDTITTDGELLISVEAAYGKVMTILYSDQKSEEEFLSFTLYLLEQLGYQGLTTEFIQAKFSEYESSRTAFIEGILSYQSQN